MYFILINNVLPSSVAKSLHDSAAKLQANIEKELSERAALKAEADQLLADLVTGKTRLERITDNVGPLISDAEGKMADLQVRWSYLCFQDIPA